jgi:protein SCO1
MTHHRSNGRVSATALILVASLAAAVGLWWGARVFAPPAQPALQAAVMYPAPRPLPAFHLTRADTTPLTLADWKGHWTVAFFGYTHCPDVCPETMARLMQVMQNLGPDADRAQIVFITVDPARDTPAALRSYMQAFDAKHAAGLSGTDSAVESIARRYRVAYQMEKRDPSGNYEVTHSSAVYIFDSRGHARLLATDRDSIDAITQDLQRVIRSTDS